MDFTLLYAAKAATKNPARHFKIAVSAALGACFAVIFPLLGFSGGLTLFIKIFAGGLLCLAGGRFESAKGYFKFLAAFFICSFIVGGGCFALFSLFNISFAAGEGFIISSAPVGIPLFFALLLCVIISKAAKKFKRSGGEAVCKIYTKRGCACVKGFYDSGNNVYREGAPVTIIPKSVAEKLVECDGIKTFVDIHTVSGSARLPVFTAEKIIIDDGTTKIERRKVELGISARHICRAVIHPDLAEAI